MFRQIHSHRLTTKTKPKSSQFHGLTFQILQAVYIVIQKHTKYCSAHRVICKMFGSSGNR